jgi:hypothetical protein
VNTLAKQGQNLDLVPAAIDALNNGFSGTGFQFRLVDTKEYLSDAWVRTNFMITGHEECIS